MRHTSTDGFGLYDATSNMAHHETLLATAALILGFGLADFEALTIDELSEATDQMFPNGGSAITTRLFGKTGLDEKNLIAATDWNTKLNQRLLAKIQLSWRDRHVSRWVSENG